MRIILALLLIASLFGVLQPQPGLAADDSFTPFWTQFKTALKKRDKEALATMTKLPFMFDSKNLNKAQFIAKVDVILPGSLSTCFAKEKPVLDKEGQYFVFCGEQIYIFNKINGKFLFTEIGVND